MALSRPLLSVCLGAAALITAAVAPVATTSAATPQFPDGKWEGYYGMDNGSAYADGDEQEVRAIYQALGNFEATAAAGAMSGRWLIDVNTVIVAEGLEAEANAVGIGAFSGPTSEVALDLVTLTVSEPTIGMTLTFTAGELPGATGGVMTVTGNDCNSVWGEWTVQFPDNTLEGQFSALRLGPEADDESVTAARRASQQALSERGRIMITAVQDGRIDLDAIRQLLQDTEGALSPGGNPSCGSEDSGSFRAATTELIDSMLFEMAGISDGLGADLLIELVLAGFRSGAFSASPDTGTFWLAAYDAAVDAALASGDRPTLAKFSATSRLLGFNDQADTIDDLLIELGS